MKSIGRVLFPYHSTQPVVACGLRIQGGFHRCDLRRLVVFIVFSFSDKGCDHNFRCFYFVCFKDALIVTPVVYLFANVQLFRHCSRYISEVHLRMSAVLIVESSHDHIVPYLGEVNVADAEGMSPSSSKDTSGTKIRTPKRRVSKKTKTRHNYRSLMAIDERKKVRKVAAKKIRPGRAASKMRSLRREIEMEESLKDLRARYLEQLSRENKRLQMNNTITSRRLSALEESSRFLRSIVENREVIRAVMSELVSDDDNNSAELIFSDLMD